jgi:hypothetical protein
VPSPDPALSSPFGLALDSTGNIYVANSDNNTVDVYYPAAGSCPAACPGGYQYDFRPIVLLTATPPSGESSLWTLTWSTIGVLPTSATCTLTTSDGDYGQSVPQTGGPVMDSLSGGATVTATLSCPGAIAIQYMQNYSE